MKRSQVNIYLFYLEKKENSEWKQIYQDMPLEEFYSRNKKKNRNQLFFYQGQYKQLNEIMRYMTKNSWP